MRIGTASRIAILPNPSASNSDALPEADEYVTWPAASVCELSCPCV